MISSFFRGDCHTLEDGAWTQSSPLSEARIIAASIQSSPFDQKNQKIFVSGGFNGQVRESLEVLTRFEHKIRNKISKALVYVNGPIFLFIFKRA